MVFSSVFLLLFLLFSSSFSSLVRFGDRDPIYPLQWHLHPDERFGLDLQSLYQNGITGQGITIGVCIVSADQHNHDLQNQLHEKSLLGNKGTYHKFTQTGTAVASLLIAEANNNFCSVGVANEAKMLLLEVEHYSTANEASNLLFSYYNLVDIYLYTFGVSEKDSYDLFPLPGVVKLGLNRYIHTGRRGKGIISIGTVVDDRERWGNCNVDELLTRREVISVSQVTREGTPGTSPICSNYIVSAPTGLQTTYDGNCSTEHILKGNQASSPLVAGAVALILQKEPNLYWYDVQFLLLASAKVIEQPGGGGWQLNGAGRLVSHDFGYGLVDAKRAIQYLGHELPAHSYRHYQKYSYSGSQRVGDCGRYEIPFSVPVDRKASEKVLQHVEMAVEIHHSVPGDMELVLVSPSGTRASLMTPRSKEFTEGTRITIDETLSMDPQYSTQPQREMEFGGVVFSELENDSTCCSANKCDFNLSEKTAVVIEQTEACEITKQINTIIDSYGSKIAMIIYLKVENHHSFRSLKKFAVPVMAMTLDIYAISLRNLISSQQLFDVKLTRDGKVIKKNRSFSPFTWKMSSTFFWEEPSVGEWRLIVSDLFCSDSGTIKKAELQLIFGTPIQAYFNPSPSPSPSPYPIPSPSPSPSSSPSPFPSPSPSPFPSPSPSPIPSPSPSPTPTPSPFSPSPSPSPSPFPPSPSPSPSPSSSPSPSPSPSPIPSPSPSPIPSFSPSPIPSSSPSPIPSSSPSPIPSPSPSPIPSPSPSPIPSPSPSPNPSPSPSPIPSPFPSPTPTPPPTPSPSSSPSPFPSPSPSPSPIEDRSPCQSGDECRTCNTCCFSSLPLEQCLVCIDRNCSKKSNSGLNYRHLIVALGALFILITLGMGMSTVRNQNFLEQEKKRDDPNEEIKEGEEEEGEDEEVEEEDEDKEKEEGGEEEEEEEEGEEEEEKEGEEEC